MGGSTAGENVDDWWCKAIVDMQEGGRITNPILLLSGEGRGDSQDLCQLSPSPRLPHRDVRSRHE